MAKVALAPMQVQVRQEKYFPNQEVIQEASDYLIEKELKGAHFLLSPPLFLKKHKRVPPYSLWHSCDLKSARIVLPHDFIILPEIKCFELRRYEIEDPLERSLQGFTHIKPLYYDVQIYIRIIDLTSAEPSLAMQEHLKWEIPVSLAQAQSDDLIENWRGTSFNGTGIASALVKVCQEISLRCQSRVDEAWSRRLPFSRLAKPSS